MALAAVLALGGCGTKGTDINDDPNAGTAQKQLDRLHERPDIDEATTTLHTLIDEVRQVTIAEFGLPPWEPPPDEAVRDSACGFDFPDVSLRDAKTRTVSGGTARGPIPDERWDAAVERISGIAAKHGFGPPQRMLDKPGDHDVEFAGPFGASFRIGTAANTTMGATSACHPTAAAKGVAGH